MTATVEPESVVSGHYRGLPVLSRDNFPDWEIQVIAFLTGAADHVRVIERRHGANNTLVDPAAPTDANELTRWNASEREAMGVIMSTACKAHRELILRHRDAGKPVFQLWTKICSLYQSRDAAHRHEAWLEFLACRKAPDELYSAYGARVEAAYAKIERITPSNQTAAERAAELTLFALLSGLSFDDPIRQSLTTQRDLTLDEANKAFVRYDTAKKIHLADAESANATRSMCCWKCDSPDHLSNACPHAGAVKDLIAKRNAASRSGSSSGGRNRRGKSQSSSSAAPAAASTAAAPAAPAAPATPPPTASPVLEASAGVATIFLTSVSGVADQWLCDSGASCSMSGHRQAFYELRGDRRPVRLADGMVVYSEGVGSVRFVSSCGHSVVIHDVLFVPRLTTSLFSANKFAREHRHTHLEVLEYPERKWINRQTNCVEFTATIRADNLAYLNWRVDSGFESANVSFEDLHARLNHIPYPYLRRLIRDGSLDGVPAHIAGPHPDGTFCEDCVNGKLTRAPHSKPAARAEEPLARVYTDVHGPVPIRSRHGNIYWVTFIDDHSRFPAVYFIRAKSDVFAAFKRYKAWAENMTGRRIRVLRDDKGGEYISADLDRFLRDAGIAREHSIRDTPQQLGVAERMNRTLDEGITTLLSQSGLSRAWWEEAAQHFLYGRIRIPSSAIAPNTSHDLFYGKKGSVERLRPFGCLAYVHLQKDQRQAFQPHAVQCVLIGYPVDYKGWRFWDPSARKEIVSDSAVFRESVFPFRRPGLSAIDKRIDPSPVVDGRVDPFPTVDPIASDHSPLTVHRARPADDQPADVQPVVAEPVDVEPVDVRPVPEPPAPRLVPRMPFPVPDMPERPRTPPEVKNLLSNFERHPATAPLPPKRPTRARLPGTLSEEANTSVVHDPVCVPVLDAMEYAFSTAPNLEPRSLAEALKRPDASLWVKAALAEIEAHLKNGTWELAQLPPGRRAIGSRWVFKIKRTPEGAIDKYKGRLVAQGFSQVPGVHYGEIFASTARFAAVRAVIAIAADEDLELEGVDISTAFLNGDIDRELYMRIPEGFEVEGEPRDGEDPARWVVRLLKGLYGIKQGPRLWALKLHSVLESIGFQRIDCDYSVYVYRRDDIKVFVPVYVDDLLLASNSKDAIRRVKDDLAAHFKLHDQGPAKSILGIKIERDRSARTISLSQPGYIQSILEDFNMADSNPAPTPMEESPKLSKTMCADTPERKAEMANVPYRELVGKLLYLAVATRPDISYAVGVLCRFVENPGPQHWGAAKRVLRYLKGSSALKLTYSRSTSPDKFVTYSDADLSGNPDNSRSTGGFAICTGGAATQWGSRLQPHVSLSSTESEYTIASKVGCEIMWMRYFFEEIGYDMSRPSPMLLDNRSALQVAKHPEHQSTMKHVHRAYHWIRDHIDRGLISVSHVPGDLNPADIFTKPLGKFKFTRFRDMLGLRA